MNTRKIGFAEVVCAVTLIFAIPSTTHSAERGVQFSGYVPAQSGALSFGPLRAYAEGLGKTAGLQLIAGNNGLSNAKIHFEAYDAQFQSVKDVALPKPVALYPGQTRTFLAVVPIMRDVARRYRICAILKAENAGEIRQCGKYIARKR